jgi:hypothetical protein
VPVVAAPLVAVAAPVVAAAVVPAAAVAPAVAVVPAEVVAVAIVGAEVAAVVDAAVAAVVVAAVAAVVPGALVGALAAPVPQAASTLASSRPAKRRGQNRYKPDIEYLPFYIKHSQTATHRPGDGSRDFYRGLVYKGTR